MRLLNDLPVYVINLDRRPDRWRQIQYALLQGGFHHIERIPAVDGKKLSITTVQRTVTPEARSTFQRTRIRHEELGSLGAVGCYLSHMNVWKRIAESGQPGIVVEDDAVITHIKIL